MRRVRVKDIEDDMDMACEQAALGPHLRNRSTGRDTWDAPTWRRYVDEAIIQARLHNHELENLRREPRQLERLLQAP